MTDDAKTATPPAAARITIKEYEELQPRALLEHAGVRMIFSTPSEMALWRVRSIRSKEPCTLEWIASFAADDVLLDCGANVGMYTIWAAATRGVRVFAFEPEAQNYAILNRNIVLNKLSERVQAYCMGLSDVSGLSQLHMADMRVGGSCHAVGEALDYKLQPLRAAFVQGCVVSRLDDLIAEGVVAVPTHIKIDVDGFEHKVVQGARRTLRNPAVKSLLIETNPALPEHRGMVEALGDLGFAYDEAQVAAAARKEGAFEGVAEYIFRR
jgi:FkbM family methyltransferase